MSVIAMKKNMHKQQIQSKKLLRQELVNGLIAIIDALDPYTRKHSINVASYAQQFARALKLSPRHILRIYYGALFHDIGKIGISPEILRKHGTLKPYEYKLIMQHPVKGAKIMSQFSTFKTLVPIIKHHHEQFNGNGYPDGLKGKKIPFDARLVAIVDTYDAITSKRTYRKALGKRMALAEICNHTPQQFDPELVDVFIRIAKKW